MAQSPAQQQEEVNESFKVADMSSYRDGFKNLMHLVKMLGVVALVLTGFDYYYISHFVPQDGYYAVSPGGAKRRLLGLSLPNVNRDAILRWAGAAGTEIFTFGFHDIDERMTRARRLFSDEGWKSFSEALGKARLLKAMMDQQHIMTAIPAAPPRMLMEGIYNGDYSWIVEIPMILTTRAGAETRNSRTNMRLVIIRMPTKQNPMGIGIKTIYAW
ncbi:MAG TPA: DotI/IcmL/TraM family protein [Patescibacteria group bacterium]|nr:DotI/IcmL/TraM family protein [Patescibacteria group bacterium]